MAAITTQEIIAALDDPDWYWSGPTLTYSIPGASATWSGYGPGEEPSNAAYSTLSAAQAAFFRQAVEAWDALINLTLNETNDAASPGDIRIAFTDTDADSPGSVAYAYFPPFRGGGAPAFSGDVWLDDSTSSLAFNPGTDEFHTFLHELGHALGLKHPFEDGAVLSAEYENMRYTVMSYDRPTDSLLRTFTLLGNGNLQVTPTPIYPSTPMLFDIIAIQNKYGVDLTTAAGANTYSFSATDAFFSMLYDAGGIDVIDLSNLSRGSDLDLNAGEYSSINYFSTAAQAAYWKALFPGFAGFIDAQVIQASTYTWTDNFVIAPGAVIEQAIGSAAADTVTGNDYGNSIWGGAGDDHVAAGDGRNFLRGEDGDDWIVGGADTDDSHGNMGNDTVEGGAGDDWVVGGKDDDRLYGQDGSDVVLGNLGYDTIEGGAGDDVVRGGKEDDIVFGHAGTDWVSGDRGSDTLTGGAGADNFHVFDGSGVDRVTDFNAAEGDRVWLLAGTQWSAAQVGADTVVTVTGAEGGQLVLVGVTFSALPTGWIFGA